MSHSKKGGLNGRRKSALKLLEKQYETFKNNVGEDGKPLDKPARITHKWVNGRSVEVQRPGRSYAAECKRLKSEIDKLKQLIR